MIFRAHYIHSREPLIKFPLKAHHTFSMFVWKKRIMYIIKYREERDRVPQSIHQFEKLRFEYLSECHRHSTVDDSRVRLDISSHS